MKLCLIIRALKEKGNFYQKVEINFNKVSFKMIDKEDPESPRSRCNRLTRKRRARQRTMETEEQREARNA